MLYTRLRVQQNSQCQIPPNKVFPWHELDGRANCTYFANTYGVQVHFTVDIIRIFN